MPAAPTSDAKKEPPARQTARSSSAGEAVDEEASRTTAGVRPARLLHRRMVVTCNILLHETRKPRPFGARPDGASRDGAVSPVVMMPVVPHDRIGAAVIGVGGPDDATVPVAIGHPLNVTRPAYHIWQPSTPRKAAEKRAYRLPDPVN